MGGVGICYKKAKEAEGRRDHKALKGLGKTSSGATDLRCRTNVELRDSSTSAPPPSAPHTSPEAPACAAAAAEEGETDCVGGAGAEVAEVMDASNEEALALLIPIMSSADEVDDTDSDAPSPAGVRLLAGCVCGCECDTSALIAAAATARAEVAAAARSA